jgi:drug/metabolite transporter (DMT)-like permease
MPADWKSRFPVGLRYMALSALFFSLMSLTVKLAGRRLPTMELVFARAVVVALLAWIDMRRRSVTVRRDGWGLLLLRGVVGFVALACFYYGVIHLPLAEATVIHFTNPVFTMLVAALLLKEAVRPRELVLVAVSLLGVVLVVRPFGLLGPGAPHLDHLGVIAAMAAAILASVAYVLVRYLRHHDAMVIVLSFALVSAVCSLPLMLPSFLWPRGSEWLVLAAVGVTTFLGQTFITLGLQRERAGRATAVGYLQIVFATAWGVLFFGDLPLPTTLLGAAVIVAGTLLLTRLRSAES